MNIRILPTIVSIAVGFSAILTAGGPIAALAQPGHGTVPAVRPAKTKIHAFRCKGAQFYFPLAAGTIGQLYLDDAAPNPYTEGSTTGLETGVDVRGINGTKTAVPVYAPVSGRVSHVDTTNHALNIDTAPGKLRNYDVYLRFLSPITVKNGQSVTAGVTKIGTEIETYGFVHMSIGFEGEQHHDDTNVNDTQDPGPFLAANLVAHLNLITDGEHPTWRLPAWCRSTAPTYRTIATGPTASCAIRAGANAGSLVCWGDSDGSISTPPPGGFTKVAVGGDEQFNAGSYACALRVQGQAVCWGTAAAPPAGSFTQLSASIFFVCGLRPSHTVSCWGSYLPAAQSAKFNQISASGNEWVCGVTTSAKLLCWGNGAPSTPPPAGNFKQVSAGFSAACALTIAGSPRCWGDSALQSATPTTKTFTQIVTNYFWACGLTPSHHAVCWGQNAPTPPVGTLTQLSAYPRTSDLCALRTGGTAVCVGESFTGAATPPSGGFTDVSNTQDSACALEQDGSGACWNTFEPTPGTYTNLGGGGSYMYAVRDDGSASCWEYTGGTCNGSVGPYRQIASGNDFTCMLKRDGSIQCVGNISGTPTGTGYGRIVAGGEFACAQAGMRLTCWGDDTYGQVSSAPTANVLQVALGFGFGCWRARLRNILHPIYVNCWGQNNYGQTTPVNEPFARIYAGGDIACGLYNDGTRACWGSGKQPPAGNYVGLSLGFEIACGVRTDGGIACDGNAISGPNPDFYIPAR